MKKLLFTVLLAFGLFFSPIRAFGIDASTLNDLSPTNTIYTSQQVDQIANDISHEITLDYALKTNVLLGVSDGDGTWTCTQSDNIYEFPLHVSNSKFTINPGYIELLGIDGKIQLYSSGFFEGVKGFYNFYNQIDENAQWYNLPSNAPGTYVLATTNDIPDVSGYVPWDNDEHNAVTIGQRSSAYTQIGKDTLAVGANIAVGRNNVFNKSAGIGSNVYVANSSVNDSNCFASGTYVAAQGRNSIVLGSIASNMRGKVFDSTSGTPDNFSFIWSGKMNNGSTPRSSEYYYSHGEGTFNINPKPVSPSTDPASGFYIGESNLVQIVNALVDQRIVYAVENGITVNGTNYVLITENTLTNVLQNYHGQVF